MFPRCRALLFAAILCLAPLGAQEHANQIEDLVTAYHKLDRFDGSVLVAEHGKVIFKKGYGMSNRELDVPNDPGTKFRLGSITKQFTAALILQLVELGKVRLDARISDYLPEYPKKNGEMITVHQLLCHQSGTPNYTTSEFFARQSRDHFEPVEFLKLFWDKPLDFDPGTKYRYSNSGYFVLGVILERVSGKRYEDLLRERIFAPAGMKNSGYDHFGAIIKKRATGYKPTPAGMLNADYLDMSTPFSAGALYSTVEDLYLWDQALYTDKILSVRSRELFFKPNMNHYAYGWMTNPGKLPGTDEKVQRMMHAGTINGFNTTIIRIPAERHLIVLLSNVLGQARSFGAMVDGITAILYGKDPGAP